MTIEDVIKKSILPLAFMVFWFWMTKTIMKVSGQTDWFWWIFIAGLPFGTHKMRLILIPRGMDTTATLPKCMQTGLNSQVQKWLTDHRFQKMRKGS